MVVFITAGSQLTSCSKGGNDPNPDPCAGKTIVITATPSASVGCGAPNGSITVTATGSSGFQFKLNASGTYQSSGIFNGLSAGTYTVFAKDAAGCEKSQPANVTATGTGFTINAVPSVTSGCGSSDGAITVTATGSTGFQYKMQADAKTHKPYR